MKRGDQFKNIYDGTVIEFLTNITEKSGTNMEFKYIVSKYKSGKLIVPLITWERMKQNWEKI